MSDDIVSLEHREAQVAELEAEIERLKAALRTAPCPGGGYTGQPKDEPSTVESCLRAGVCGCDMGAALERKP